jgi:hypothetical protein
MVIIIIYIFIIKQCMNIAHSLIAADVYEVFAAALPDADVAGEHCSSSSSSSSSQQQLAVVASSSSSTVKLN